jgi:D-serine deaminase-like pyridoxal phosphate-dependent protein
LLAVLLTCMALPQVWRPHCKAIRTPQIAKLLVEHGAVGVTCAKLSQAEALLDGGIEDVPHRAANPRGPAGPRDCIGFLPTSD